MILLWNDERINLLLNFVWAAYDSLTTEDWVADADERKINQELELAIRHVMRGDNGFGSIEVQHGTFEYEAHTNPRAQPPAYDITFRYIPDPRVSWPLEAKLLKGDQDTSNLGRYIDAIESKYLTCYYAPFSSGGAMLAYLKQGDPSAVASLIAARLGTVLMDHPVFPDRCHKTSDHTRSVPPGKDYPRDFRCHHLILPLT